MVFVHSVRPLTKVRGFLCSEVALSPCAADRVMLCGNQFCCALYLHRSCNVVWQMPVNICRRSTVTGIEKNNKLIWWIKKIDLYLYII